LWNVTFWRISNTWFKLLKVFSLPYFPNFVAKLNLWHFSDFIPMKRRETKLFL
jgi:hypothetical protein